MGVNGSLGPRGADDLTCIWKLSLGIEVVGIVTCHAASIYGFGSDGNPVGGRDHHAGNCCALGGGCTLRWTKSGRFWSLQFSFFIILNVNIWCFGNAN